MNTEAFYELVSGTCFVLVGLWWTVVESRKEWLKDRAMRALAGGVYFSFLLPGVMSLMAQIGGTDKLFWRIIFSLAALIGIVCTTLLLARARTGTRAGFFRTNLWLPILVYSLILVVAVFPQIDFPTLKPLQMEGILLALLILLAHGLVWDFMTETRVSGQE
jgi:hypothetical protein